MATGNIVAGGVLIGGGNSILAQGFQNGFNNIDFNQVAMGATMGGITSCLGGHIGKGLQGPLSKVFSSVGSPMLREGLTYGTNGALTGFMMGTGMAVAGGEDIGDALQIGGKSAFLGFGAGFGYGMYSGYKYAQANNLNPINGKSNNNVEFSDRSVTTFQNHAFANNRHDDINLNSSEITSETQLLIKNNSNYLHNGDNTFTVEINGAPKIIRVHVQNGTIQSFNLMPNNGVNIRPSSPIINLPSQNW